MGNKRKEEAAWFLGSSQHLLQSPSMQMQDVNHDRQK